jgi:FKBP-type peptidyl-prolyl cis-trans isomerase 2
MAEAAHGDTVKVHYTGRLDDGTVFDSSEKREPIEFTIGEGKIIAGFEESVVGMTSGESKKTTIPPEKAYGPRDPELIGTVPLQELPETIEPRVGQELAGKSPDGQRVVVTVTAVSEADITIDANHPLAGKDLTFEIHVVEVRKAA